MEYRDKIIESGLFDEIKSGDYDKALEGLKILPKNFEKNQNIFFEGDRINSICIIDNGSVRAEKVYENGDVHIAEVFEEGSIFALDIATSKTKKSALDYVSNTDSFVIFISMDSIARSPYASELKTALMYKLADSSVKRSHKIEILAERGLRDRILVYLNILAQKAKSRTVTVTMSREQLAQYLCVNRSALSSELSKMKRDGVLNFDKNSFTLLKRPSDLPGDK